MLASQALSTGALPSSDSIVHYPGTHRLRMLDLLSAEELKMIMCKGKSVNFSRGQTIVARGSIPHVMYYLTEGRVVSKDVSGKGQEFVVRFYAQGDFFSWLFMFRRMPSAFEYHAQSACTVMAIDLEHFEKLVYQDSSLSLRLNRVLIERLESAYMVTNEYITESAVPRVAHLVGRLARRYGNGCDQTTLSGFSQHDISTLAGLSRPRTSEALAELQRLGLLKVRREILIVIDVEKLLSFKYRD